jgi:hypothetical protein
MQRVVVQREGNVYPPGTTSDKRPPKEIWLA